MSYNLVELSRSPSRDVSKVMSGLGVSPEGAEILRGKARMLLISFSRLDTRGANILKQESLARGGDCAIPWGGVIADTPEVSGLLFIGEGRARNLAGKLELQPFGLPEFASELNTLLDNMERTRRKPWRNTLLPGEPPWVMGIVNVTPDSFSDGGENLEEVPAVTTALDMLNEGASVIDVGGESTRPGARPVTAEEEKARVIPVIEELRSRTSAPISVDTTKPEVALAALDSGATWLNDVSGFRNDAMVEVAASAGVPVVTMHMQGEPRTMQENPSYDDVVLDTISFLRHSVERLERAGLDREKIVIDPGFGFGKTVEHNMEMVRRLGEYRSLGQPILLGASRKSAIGVITGRDEPKERLFGTLAVHTLGMLNGADIVRVHDVEAHMDAAKLLRF